MPRHRREDMMKSKMLTSLDKESIKEDKKETMTRNDKDKVGCKKNKKGS